MLPHYILPAQVRRVLILSSDVVLIDDLVQQFKLHEYMVVGVVDTVEATLQIASTTPTVDVACIDIALQQEWDCIALASILFKQYGMPILFLEEEASEATVERCTAIEVSGFVLKPINYGKLFASVEIVIRQHTLRQQFLLHHQLLEAILQNIGDAVIATDHRGMVTFLNPEAERLTGWLQADALGVPIEQLLILRSAHTNATFENPIAAVLRTGERVDMPSDDIILSGKHGQEYYIEDAACPLFNVNRAVIGTVLNFRDITQHHQARKAVAKIEEKYRLLFQGIPEPVWICHAQTLHCLDANSSALEQYGYTSEELAGLHVKDLFVVAEEFNRNDWLHSAHEHTQVVHRTKHGEELIVELNWTRMRIDDDDVLIVICRNITERVVLQQRLHATQSMFEQFLKHAPMPMFVVDEQGIIEMANSNANSILPNISGVVSKNIRELIDEDTAQLILAQNDDIIRSGKSVEFERSFVIKNKRHIYHTIKFPLPIQEKKLSVGTIAIDITERRKVEQELYLDAFILAHIHDGVVFTDMQGSVQYWNKSTENIFGWTADEMIGQYLNLHTQRKEEADEIYRQLIQGEVYQGEWREINKFGKHIIVSVNARLIYNEDESPAGVLSIMRDITEEVLIRESLSRVETTFQEFISNAPMLLYVVDKEDKIRIGNNKFCALFGKSENEVLGSRLSDLFPQDQVAYFHAQNEQVILQGVTQEFSESVEFNGVPHHYTTIKFPIPNADGSIDAIGGISIDITDQVNIRNKILENERLLNEMSAIATVGGWELDVKTMRVSWTKEVYKIYGVEDDFDSNVEDAISFYAPHSRAVIIEAVGNALKGQEFDVEVDFITAQQNAKIVRAVGKPFYENGVITKVFGAFQDVTKERMRDRELRLQTELLSILFERIPVMTLVISREGVPIFSNKEFEQRMGWNAEELAAISLEDIRQHIFPDELYRQEAVNALESWSQEWHELHMYTKDGREIDILWSGVELSDGRRVGFAIDITDQKLSIEQLRMSEDRLQLAVEAAGFGVWDWDITNDFLIWDESMFRLYGRKSYDFSGAYEAFEQSVFPEDLEYINDAIARAVESGEPLDAEFRIVHGETGEVRNIRVVAKTFEQGTLHSTKHLIGVNFDITHQKKAENKVRESEQQYRSLVQQSKDAIVIVDVTGTMRFVSPASKEMFGYTPEEYYADPTLPTKTLTQESVQIFTEFWEHYHKHGVFPEKVLEFMWIHKQGHIIRAEHSFVNIYDQNGVVSGFQSIARDITRQKQTEMQMMRMQRMDSIGMLAGGIAHDMNNILTPLIAGLQLLEIKATGKDLVRIQSMQDVVWRGANLVKQILLFSKGGNQERQHLQPMLLIKEIIHLVRETFPKDIHVQVQESDHISEVFVDPNQMHQVLMNLLINARDAMPQGGNITVGIQTTVLSDDNTLPLIDARAGQYLHISVADTGIGMSKEIKEKIFEPFFTTKAEHKGTGLGLTTVYGIVKNHGGFIDVESEFGRGTVFHVYIPVEDTMPIADYMTYGVQSILQGKGETILIIDDEELVLDMLADSLELHGYDVAIAHNGEQGVALFAQAHTTIALAVVDMQMPVLDGLATIVELRKIRPNIKIIAVTGFLDSDRFRILQSLEVDAIMSKPYDIKDLLKKIKIFM